MSSIYCCGFLFTSSMRHVLLVKKTHPNWQRGLLNGIGGGIENNETSGEAMMREFKEETGLLVLDWRLFCRERGEIGGDNDYVVDFYASKLPVNSRWTAPVKNDVGEVIGWFDTSDIALPTQPVVGNLRWMIPLAMDWRSKTIADVIVRDHIRDNPSW